MVSEGQIMHCPVGGYNTHPKNAREQFALSIAELRLHWPTPYDLLVNDHGNGFIIQSVNYRIKTFI